uniref:Bifunctional inhibitor/plant lipid transfer protein/seed storage helical domain-containing protein n=1 Tax=Leersia perrieri TaxID=77586 RepID=A0A0D9W0B2_9ORYZ
MAASAARWCVAAAMVLAAILGVTQGDFAADRAECADKLMGLATCLTYVEEKATAKAPTRDCCAGLGQVVAASKKCLCVLVKDRDEPALGFRINVTRAMDLPDACSMAGATFSDCPKMLNMSPNSKEAEIFQQYAREHESKNGTKSAPAAAAAATGSTGATAATGDAGVGQQRRSWLAVLVAGVAVIAAVFGL